MPQPETAKDTWAAEPENSSKENEVIEVKSTGKTNPKAPRWLRMQILPLLHAEPERVHGAR